jgi:hypothetical protein
MSWQVMDESARNLNLIFKQISDMQQRHARAPYSKENENCIFNFYFLLFCIPHWP